MAGLSRPGRLRVKIRTNSRQFLTLQISANFYLAEMWNFRMLQPKRLGFALFAVPLRRMRTRLARREYSVSFAQRGWPGGPANARSKQPQKKDEAENIDCPDNVSVKQNTVIRGASPTFDRLSRDTANLHAVAHDLQKARVASDAWRLAPNAFGIIDARR
jgi:hypothetical protein